MSEDQLDYDRLMQANLGRVFNEHNARTRAVAIAEIYAVDAVFYEPGHIATGHAEIAATISALLASLPSQFVFTAEAPGVGHHGLGRLRWRAGPPGGPAAVTGTDVARFEADRIKTLHVFLDLPAASDRSA